MRVISRSLTVLIANCLIIIACNKQYLPVITDRNGQATLRKSDTTNRIADTVSGRIVFIRRCDRCHGLPDPVQYSPERWETIIELMGPKARLSHQQTFDVLNYLKASAKKQ